uniref:Uncharacterized protein n=1 Tax=Cucumis melo TaxID=3656 RepID=A0A9I9EK34_CUCME
MAKANKQNDKWPLADLFELQKKERAMPPTAAAITADRSRRVAEFFRQPSRPSGGSRSAAEPRLSNRFLSPAAATKQALASCSVSRTVCRRTSSVASVSSRLQRRAVSCEAEPYRPAAYSATPSHAERHPSKPAKPSPDRTDPRTPSIRPSLETHAAPRHADLSHQRLHCQPSRTRAAPAPEPSRACARAESHLRLSRAVPRLLPSSRATKPFEPPSLFRSFTPILV